jgi:hypothetical protein
MRHAPAFRAEASLIGGSLAGLACGLGQEAWLTP